MQIGFFYTGALSHTRHWVDKALPAGSADNIAYIHIDRANSDSMKKYSHLLFGLSPQKDGSIQNELTVFLPKIHTLNLADKVVAFVDTCESSPTESFLTGLTLLYDAVAEQGGTLLGSWPLDSYEYTSPGNCRLGAMNAGQHPDGTKRWQASIAPFFT